MLAILQEPHVRACAASGGTGNEKAWIVNRYTSEETLKFVRLLDAALVRRKDGKVDGYEDLKCEVCGQNIHRYIGPNPGVICSTCLEQTREGQCVRISPLAITRGTMNESGRR